MASIESSNQALQQQLSPLSSRLNLLTSDVQGIFAEAAGTRAVLQSIEARLSPMDSGFSAPVAAAGSTQMPVQSANSGIQGLMTQLARRETSFTEFSQSTNAGIAAILEGLAIIRDRSYSSRAGNLIFDESNIAHTSAYIRRRRDTSRPPTARCTCRLLRSDNLASFFNLRLRYAKCEDHHPNCYLYKYRRTSRTFAMRVLLSPLFDAAVVLSIMLRTEKTIFGLSPAMDFVRVVKRATSPAFALFNRRNVAPNDDWFYRRKQVTTSSYRRMLLTEEQAMLMADSLERLSQDLTRLFDLGQASARDQDENGVTLLDVSGHKRYQIAQLIWPRTKGDSGASHGIIQLAISLSKSAFVAGSLVNRWRSRQVCAV